MTLDSALIVSFVSAFARCSAMLLASPIFGGTVPVKVRVMFSLVVSFALVPVVREYHTTVPQDLMQLVLILGKDVVIGLVIGGMVQIFLSAFQMAGSFLDIHIGIGSAQLFNPMTGDTASPIGQLKFMLGLVLLLITNGHHLMFWAFVKSYGMAGPGIDTIGLLQSNLLLFLGQMSMMALQIAAPVAAIAVVIDAAAGLVNKAVPQTQPFLLALPAKLGVGLIVLAVGLPALVVATQSGVDMTFSTVSKMLGGS